MNGETVVEINNVQKSFGKKEVLRGISGQIPAGRVVGILGRNGEGKTTLFKIMLDILASDFGSVSILGLSPDGTARIRQKVGYIPERPTFHDFMKISDVLKLREGFFPTWSRPKAEAMAKQLELDLKTPIKGASKGTLAKLSWVCATAHNPKVLLLDEPTSGLDIVVRDSVLTQFVREMADEGKTILVANHHMEELFGVLDEVWILAEGRIQEMHPVEQLRHDAFRVTGRLRSPGGAPEGVVEEQRTGDLVRWLVVDKDALYRIRSQDLLENMQEESLPLETTLKVLLSRKKAPM